MSILFSCENDDDHVIENQLRLARPDEELFRWPECGDKSKVEFAVIWGPPAEFFSDLTNLKVIFSLAAGVDHVLYHPGLPKDVPIVRLEDAGMGEKMAEYVLYGVLHAQRNFGIYLESQKRQHWADDAGTTHAKDFRVGILGLGTLGTCVAQRLLMNNYAVSGWSRRPKTLTNIETHSGVQGLENMLPDINVLVCLLPLTRDTRHILNTALFSQCQPGLFLINLARGGHLQDDDLLNALETGRISGALLDVTDPEPLPSEHPFWGHPRVVLTPHIAGPTQEQESVKQIADNIARYRTNATMRGIVDRSAGY